MALTKLVPWGVAVDGWAMVDPEFYTIRCSKNLSVALPFAANMTSYSIALSEAATRRSRSRAFTVEWLQRVRPIVLGGLAGNRIFFLQLVYMEACQRHV